jgi:hypothetical protein
MNAVLLAKARCARRASQGGAVMFLVTMTLAVLASVGLYALAAATSEVTASGSERQATQTHYLAEYGLIGGAQMMSASRAQSYIATMVSAPDTGCWSLPNITVANTPDPILRACSHVQDTEIASAGGWTGATFATFGGMVAATPDFYVEYTGLSKAFTPPRYALNLNICFAGITESAYGSTKPANTNQFGQGIETQRARLIAGPVTGSICQ